MLLDSPVANLRSEKRGTVSASSIRVLVVEDYEPWRLFYCSTLQKQTGFQVIGEVSDGQLAIQRAEELHPDLILLDIGLPTLNGIDTARGIRKVSPKSVILFVSENCSADIVEEALSTGAGGYVVKSDAANELMTAVNAVLEGKRYVSTCLAGHELSDSFHQPTADHLHRGKVLAFTQPQNGGTSRSHEVGFYTEDHQLLDDVTRFIGSALKSGNAAIVVATESHRHNLLLQLQAHGVDMGTAIEQGRYIPLDAAETLSLFMVKGMPDPVRFLELLGDLIITATEAVKGEQPRVSLFGECVNLLWAQGNADAAVELEKLGNKLTRIHNVDILCGYDQGCVEGGMDSGTYLRICAEHTAVYSR
jgi:DNA-binding NarL/FixJ family response regulator